MYSVGTDRVRCEWRFLLQWVAELQTGGQLTLTARDVAYATITGRSPLHIVPTNPGVAKPQTKAVGVFCMQLSVVSVMQYRASSKHEL